MDFKSLASTSFATPACRRFQRVTGKMQEDVLHQILRVLQNLFWRRSVVAMDESLSTSELP